MVRAFLSDGILMASHLAIINLPLVPTMMRAGLARDGCPIWTSEVVGQRVLAHGSRAHSVQRRLPKVGGVVARCRGRSA